MVVDSSALLSILLQEQDAGMFAAAIATAVTRTISAATLVEAGMLIESRKGRGGGWELDNLIKQSGVEVVPLDAEQATFAREAFRRFGKGRHPARLNLGDCFSYALSKASGEPLLFKGNDFSQTDIDAYPL